MRYLLTIALILMLAGAARAASVGIASQVSGNAQVRLTGGLLPTAVRVQIEQQVEDQVADAFAFADSSPFPTDEELWTHVYAD